MAVNPREEFGPDVWEKAMEEWKFASEKYSMIVPLIQNKLEKGNISKKELIEIVSNLGLTVEAEQLSATVVGKAGSGVMDHWIGQANAAYINLLNLQVLIEQGKIETKDPEYLRICNAAYKYLSSIPFIPAKPY